MMRIDARTPTKLALMAAIGLTGCGAMPTASFPNEFAGSSGRAITVEDVEAIVNDPDLDASAKREALRALGIEDEKLIDALLDL